MTFSRNSLVAGCAVVAGCAPTPPAVPGPACTSLCEGQIVALDTGFGSTCAVYETGALYCWGARRGVVEDIYPNRPSCCGYPIRGPVDPVRVPLADRVVQVSLGLDYSCAVSDDGDPWCWGAGVGPSGTTRLEPIQRSSWRPTVYVSVGSSSSCEVYADGGMLCGGDLESRFFDTMGPDDAVAAANGILLACALASDGHIECAGNNAYGDVGDGTTELRRVPTRVLGIDDAVEIAAHGFACARLRSGRVKCWGPGSLGDGTSGGSSVPVEVLGVENAIQIDVGFYGAYALLTDGTVMAWGDVGALVHGDGDPTARSPGVYTTPVPVDGIDDAVYLTANGDTACVLRSNGEVWCWGNAGFGQRAVPFETPRWPPTRALGLPCPCTL